MTHNVNLGVGIRSTEQSEQEVSREEHETHDDPPQLQHRCGYHRKTGTSSQQTGIHQGTDPGRHQGGGVILRRF